MERSLKVAVPLTAALVRVPLKVPPAGLLLIVKMTFAVLALGLPNWSDDRTVTAGDINAAALVLPGWLPKASAAAVPLTSANAPPLVPPVTPVAVPPNVMLPAARGVPLRGRTLMPDQVKVLK